MASPRSHHHHHLPLLALVTACGQSVAPGTPPASEPGVALPDGEVATADAAGPVMPPEGDMDPPEPEPADRKLPDGFAFVVRTSAGTFAVLETRPEVEAVGGPIELDVPAEASHAWAVRRALPSDAGGLPAPSNTASPLVLYGPRGAVCEASVGEPSLLARVEPRWDLMAGFSGDAEYPPVDPADMARELWGLGAADRFLAARVDPDTDDCAEALWARPADAPPPLLFRQVAASRRIERRAVAAFRALPEYARIQAEFQGLAEGEAPSEPWGVGSWESHDEGALEVRAFEAEGRSLVSVAASAGYGCGDFYGALWAIFELHPAGGAELLALGHEVQAPVAVFDLERDGEIEVLLQDVLSTGGVRERATVSIEVPYFDCPC